MYAPKHKGSRSRGGILNSTEKYLNKSLKITMKNLALVLNKVVTMVMPPKPPPEELVFMTYIINVEKKVEGWQKSILAVLKKTKQVRNFKIDERGRVVVSAAADLKTFLKGIGKAKAKLEWIQSGQCSSNLYMPQVGGYGYGYDYYGDGMYPFHGGYGGGQQRGFGYVPMGYNYDYNYNGNVPFDYRQGMNYMAPQAYPLMNDERMNNCPCEF